MKPYFSLNMPPIVVPVRNWLLDALFPPRCAGCRVFCRELFCIRCAATILPLSLPYCRICAEPFDPLAFHDPLCRFCREAKTNFDCARAAWLYEGAARGAIHKLKYDGKSALAERLSPILSQTVLSDDTLKAVRFDIVVAVPLHPRRQRKRGFNQSELLAQSLGQQLEVPFGQVLKRIRATPPQVGLNRKERQSNIHGAFAVAPKFKMAPNANVLLVDDVFTTGATLRECATVLKQAGAHNVCAVTLARQSAPS